MTAPTFSHEFKDVMLDIETLSLHPNNALILSIGLVEFDPAPHAAPIIGKAALILPDIAEQIVLGREVSPATQKFWKELPKEASEHWRIPVDDPRTHRTLRAVASRIETFVGDRRVWANHVAFDIANIEGLCFQAGLEKPWHYRTPQDVPTILGNNDQFRRNFTLDEEKGLLPISYSWTEHHPITDCISQIARLWEHWAPSSEIAHVSV